MENIPQDLREIVNSLNTCYEERFSRLEQSFTDIQSKLTSLNAAVERALSSLLPKVESLISEARIESDNSSDKPATDTGEADAPSSSGTKAPSVSNPVTSVTEAAAAGDTVALRRMLAGPNARDSNGVTALYLAASGGHVDAVGALLEEGANAEVTGPGLRTALHVATEKGHVDVVRRLLKAKAKTETKDANGNTPLMIAVKNKQLETLRCLVSAGANVNNATDGITPLMLAVKGKQWTLVRLLVENGADSNARVFIGPSALELAAAEGHIETIAMMLRQKKPKHVDEALSYAKNVSVVWTFEDALPGVIRNNGGWALIKAAEGGRLESMVALLDAGVDVDNKNTSAYTALVGASENGHAECVKELVLRGANLNARDKSMYSALHWASQKGREEVVRVLLDAGADSTVRNEDGKTPLDLARSECIKDIFRNHLKHTA